MRSAPKRGEHVLLAYPSFTFDGTFVVNQGRYIDAPSASAVSIALESIKPGVVIHKMGPSKCTKGWVVSFATDVEFIRMQGMAWRNQWALVRPVAWMPLPAFE